ncbi:ferredoxin [Bacteroidia bacterium]|nr:ferredoxin [Bacteroidia bacterium]
MTHQNTQDHRSAVGATDRRDKTSAPTGHRTLKIVRVVLALLFFLPLVAFFLDFSGWLPLGLHSLAHLQFIPALLAGMWGVVAVLLLLTLLVGRVYCSVVCPLGVLQDVIGRCARIFPRLRPKVRRKRTAKALYRKPYNIIRYSLLAVAAIPAIFFASTFPLLWLDPYSNFGRIAAGLIKPVYIWGNNLLAARLNAHGNFSLYAITQHPSTVVIVSAAVVLAALAVMVALRGRLWCNTLCPVGTLLGLISRRSLVRVTIDPQRCNHCNLCTGTCKAECIDQRNAKVDMSRCVACYNCLSVCNRGAIGYGARSLKPEAAGATADKTTADMTAAGATSGEATTASLHDGAGQGYDPGRRRFIATAASALAAAPVIALARRTEAATGAEEGSSPATRRYPLPPGAVDNFAYRCTACQLCVSKCPMQALRPSGLERGLTGVMQPHMYFEPEVYCNYECTACTQVCPNGALQPLSVEQKKVRQVGVVRFVRHECIVQKQHQDCGACAEHCPTGAVAMVPFGEDQSLTIPQIDPQVCIGCGACESICPVRPDAIFVVGLEPQGTALPPRSDNDAKVEIDGFGF